MRSVLMSLAVLLLALTLLPAGPVMSEPGGAGQPRKPVQTGDAEIHEDLVAETRAARQAGERQQALMVLEDTPDLSAMRGNHDTVVSTLRQEASTSQSDVEAALARRRRALGNPRILNSFWIQNMMLVEFDPAPRHLRALSALDGVERLVPNAEVVAIEPEPSDATLTVVDDRTWGIDRIEAHRVHDELGVDGTGVRVATLDTGVDITHPDLAGKISTDDTSDPSFPGGWMQFDPQGGLISSEPYDSHEHGTHVSGTIHGGDASDVQIGVAPGAEMMHGLVLPGGSGNLAQVVAGMQWAIDPTDAAGNPAGEPADVVSMSLGVCAAADELITPTRNIRAAGVVPVFAIGNDSSSCVACGPVGTASPGNIYDAVAIGATNEADDVAELSCGAQMDKDDWGEAPAEWPDTYVKPDLTAPGVGVLSSVPGGGYASFDGTSMATPHVAGTAALMLEAEPDLDVDGLFSRLADTSFFDDRHGPDRPNDRFGNGRINAFEATEAAFTDSGVVGVATDADGQPLADVVVAEPTTGRSTTTAADGTYTLRLPPGTYDITAERFGYETTTIGGIEVPDGGFAVQDLVLSPIPSGAITGTVTMAASGHGVPGVPLSLVGTPLEIASGPDGSFTFSDVPAGTYEIEADPFAFPRPAATTVTVVAGETENVDIALDAPAPPVGILGDYEGAIGAWLGGQGVSAVDVTWDDANLDDFRRLVVNYPEDPGEEGFLEFLDETDAAGTGVVFLETYPGDRQGGIGLLNQYLGNPADYLFGWSVFIPVSYYEVLTEHPILEGWEPGEQVPFDVTTPQRVHAWFEGYEGEGRETIALAGPLWDGIARPGIGVQERDSNRHALLSMHGAEQYMSPRWWTPEGGEIFLNALDWVAPDAGDHDYPVFVTSDLEIAPDETLSGEPVEVTANVTNVGPVGGDHTASLLVDGAIEDSTTISLDSGESTEVAWTVSRDELGTYDIQVGHLSEEFRVRPPVVELSVTTLDSDRTEPRPMAGATVALLHGDQLVEVGTTDDAGALSLEALAADAEYTLVVRRAAVADDEHAYLLTRPVRIDGDTQIAMEPRTLASGKRRSQYAWNLSAVADLDLDKVDKDHRAATYLRNSLTAPYGFAFEPGPVVVTVSDADGYEAVVTHTIERAERDWWYASDIIEGLDWRDPVDQQLSFGGRASPQLEAELNGTELSVEWGAVDKYDRPFATMRRTELRPFVNGPDVMRLEEIVPSLVERAPDELDVMLRLFDPSGEQVHAGGVTWDQRRLTRDLSDVIVDEGTYTLRIEIDTEEYSRRMLIAETDLEVELE